MIRAEIEATLRQAGDRVEQEVTPNGVYGGWSGHDVLIHLGGYTRLVGALLRGVAEEREASESELYGRELTPAERAMTDLNAINQAVIDEYAHLTYEEARALWQGLHRQAMAELGRLSDDQLALQTPEHAARWQRPHLSDVVTSLCAHYDAHLSGQPH